MAVDSVTMTGKKDANRVALAELLGHIRAAESLLLTPGWLSAREIVERVWLCVHALEQRARALNLTRMACVAAQIGKTLRSMRHTATFVDREAHEVIERGLMVLALIVRDLDRQLDGHSPAALDEVIDTYLACLRHSHRWHGDAA